MLKFNGKEIELPWPGWEGVRISPEGIHTHRGVIGLSSLKLAQWGHNLPRRTCLRIVDNAGNESFYRLEKISEVS